MVPNMLFIDNLSQSFVNPNYCFGWGWYLAVDFQLFIITPFLFLAYSTNKKLGLVLILIVLAGSFLCAWLLIYINNWHYPVLNPVYSPQI